MGTGTRSCRARGCYSSRSPRVPCITSSAGGGGRQAGKSHSWGLGAPPVPLGNGLKAGFPWVLSQPPRPPPSPPISIRDREQVLVGRAERSPPCAPTTFPPALKDGLQPPQTPPPTVQPLRSLPDLLSLPESLQQTAGNGKQAPDTAGWGGDGGGHSRHPSPLTASGAGPGGGDPAPGNLRGRGNALGTAGQWEGCGSWKWGGGLGAREMGSPESGGCRRPGV